MIQQNLSILAPTSEISTLRTNQQYGFNIHWVHLPEYNCHFLFTEGLSNNIQNVKEGFESFKKIELYFCLPDYWKLDTDKWPIEWLEKLACLPQKNNTWFGPGDTIPAGNPPMYLSDRFEANHFMLVEPIRLAPFFENKIWEVLDIRFLGIVPISQGELDYKIRNSATVLTRRLKKANHSEKVDMFRTSVCRKRFLGLI
ncbi:MAG: hypothetical protein GQ574_03095 [Crocinitomix sp.]|nr:hypothetical protein [Crocinitomix sp.]